MPKGIAQVCAQVAEKLCRASNNFSRRGVAPLSRPELLAVKKDEQGFEATILAHIRQHRPELAGQDIQLARKGAKIEFILGPSET